MTDAKTLFDEIVVPLARSDAPPKLSFRALPVDGTYYRPAYRSRLAADDMLKVTASGELDALRQLWTSEAPELLALMPGLQQIADRLAEERANQGTVDPDAPSTLIYQMF